MQLELAHDLVAKQIFSRFSEEEKALRKASRLLRDSYELHTELLGKQQEGRLLTRSEVAYLEQFLHVLDPEPEVAAYLEASRTAILAKEEAEKERLRAKIAQQRRFIAVAIAAGVIILGVAVFAGIQYQVANDAKVIAQAERSAADSARQVAVSLNDSLKVQVFQTFLANGNAAMSGEQYGEAIRQFEGALPYSTAADSQLVMEKIETSRQLGNTVGGFNQLIQAGDQLAARKAFRAAIGKYQEALALAYDDELASSKLRNTQRDLNIEFGKLVEQGRGFLTVKQYELALRKFEAARSLKPGDSYVRESIQACKQALEQ